MSSLLAALLEGVMGPAGRLRVRVAQTLLGMPALLLIHALLVLEWHTGELGGTLVAGYVGVTLGGCVVFYALVRTGWSERLSTEASLSRPQMAYAMVCVAGAYAVAGSHRAAMLSLMPLILCFGIFALEARRARQLARFGAAVLAVATVWRVGLDPDHVTLEQEMLNWVFVACSMGMIRILAERLSRMRAHLNAQKAELAEALERIRELATRDALTGLLNRRAMMDELDRGLRIAARSRQPLTIALVDLDHFKRINDEHGHQVGDLVLQAFARLAERELRASDRVARWGGEEFLFMLADTDEVQAMRCLDRLRSAFAQEPLADVPASLQPDFSAGVARCEGPQALGLAIEQADRALYRAKLGGRGRTAGIAVAADPIVLA